MPRLYRVRLLVTITILLFFWAANVSACAQFATRARKSLTTNAAYAMAVGDLNGDGAPDVAVIVAGGFEVLVNNGDGIFQDPVFYASTEALSLAIADFNGDGKMDIVLANVEPSVVSVYLGNGDGTFQPAPIASPTSFGSYYVVVGDFNNDHKPDVAIIDPPYVSVLLGRGDGSFGRPSDNDSFEGPQQLALGDFNNDRFLDVLVSGGSGLNSEFGVLLGNGDGTLQPAITSPLQQRTESPGAVGDFNHDGNLDFAISQDGVEVFLGNGNGTFQPPVDYAVGRFANGVVVGDFSHDGNLDLVEASGPPAAVAEFVGNGDGTFEPVVFFLDGVGGGAYAGDFNRDGMLDLALFNPDLGVTTMLNTGTINFSPSSPVVFPTQPIDTTSAAQVVALANTGTAAVSISSVSVSGDFRVAKTCGDVIGPGATCEIDVSFAPRRPGFLRGLIVIHDGASSKPEFIDLSGLGTPLVLAPSEVSFGHQKLGTTSAPQAVTVTNEGRDSVAFYLITVDGGDAPDFAIASQTCGAQLAAGSSCQVEITFSPRKAGVASSGVAVSIVGGANPPLVKLSGTGTR